MIRRAPGQTAVVNLSVLALGALAVLVRAGITHEADRAVLGALQRSSNGAFDLIANVHTLTGLPYVTLPVAGAISLLLWRRGHGMASLAPLLLVGTVIVELALKLTTGHAPPGPETSRRFIQLVPSLDTPSSFPSGHASRLTFLSAFAALTVPDRAVTLARRRTVRLVAIAFVALTLVARVYIGDHWPTDVLGGAALGLALAVPAAGWVRRTRGRRVPPAS